MELKFHCAMEPTSCSCAALVWVRNGEGVIAAEVCGSSKLGELADAAIMALLLLLTSGRRPGITALFEDVRIRRRGSGTEFGGW